MIKTFDELYDAVGKKPKKRVVGAWAVDDHTIGALALAVQKGFVDAIVKRSEQKSFLTKLLKFHGGDKK